MRRAVSIGLLAAALLLGSVAVGSAHVAVEPSEVPAGASRTFAFSVPHGCEGEATTSVALRLPPTIVTADPRPASGWDLVVENEADGATIATWSGGSLPDGSVATFRVRLTTPDAPRTMLYIPVVQECEDGRYRWIQIPGDGESYEELATPAPRIALGDPPATGETGQNETTPTSTTGDTPPDPQPETIAEPQPETIAEPAPETIAEPADDSGTTPSVPVALALALVLALGTIGVVIGFVIARRRRP